MAKKILTVAELVRKAGKAGGRARARNLTAEELREIGRKGGLAGGKARAAKLSKRRRSEIARNAVAARWNKKAGA